MTRVVLAEPQIIDWTPRLCTAMLVRGVQIGDRKFSRWHTVKRLAEVFRSWWQWTAALPGDRFWEVQRDLIIQVEHGMPSRRTARIVTGRALQYRTVRKMGLDALFAMETPEPCRVEWWQVVPLSRPKNQEDA